MSDFSYLLTPPCVASTGFTSSGSIFSIPEYLKLHHETCDEIGIANRIASSRTAYDEIVAWIYRFCSKIILK